MPLLDAGFPSCASYAVQRPKKKPRVSATPPPKQGLRGGRGPTMTYTGIYGSLAGFAARLITTSRLIAFTMVAAFTAVAMQPAQAQTSDMWKSAAIIGGSTAAGAYIGHKVAGRTGAYIGAGIGATAGYAIDRRRRQNEAYNQGYYPDNGNNGYYDPNG